MADFILSYKITILGNEKGYNPGIGEKETYMGIDRGANPNWPGWKIIDNIKLQNHGITTARMNMLLATNAQLQANIIAFYKGGYWDVVNLDKVNDQQLANNLFDCSVNQGEGLGRRFMQIACNYVLATSKAAIKPLVIDAQIGSATLGLFNSLAPDQLMAEINAEREASYRRDKEYPEWGKVWEKRLLNYIKLAA